MPNVVETRTVRVPFTLTCNADGYSVAMALLAEYSKLQREGWRVVAILAEIERPAGRATLIKEDK